MVSWASSLLCPAGIPLDVVDSWSLGATSLLPTYVRASPAFKTMISLLAGVVTLCMVKRTCPELNDEIFLAAALCQNSQKALALSGHPSAGPIDTSSTPVRDKMLCLVSNMKRPFFA